jgi:hypothetical protein
MLPLSTFPRKVNSQASQADGQASATYSVDSGPCNALVMSSVFFNEVLDRKHDHLDRALPRGSGFELQAYQSLASLAGGLS